MAVCGPKTTAHEGLLPAADRMLQVLNPFETHPNDKRGQQKKKGWRVTRDAGVSTKVYLDTSVYNRPFDDQTQPRIWLETLAFGVILQMIEAGSIELVTSSVLEYGNSRNPFQLRRNWVARCSRLAEFYYEADERVRQRAEALEQEGLRAIDALHVACAEAAGSEYFLTCDDRLIRGYQEEKTRVLNPVDFVVRFAEVEDDRNSDA